MTGYVRITSVRILTIVGEDNVIYVVYKDRKRWMTLHLFWGQCSTDQKVKKTRLCSNIKIKISNRWKQRDRWFILIGKIYHYPLTHLNK